MKILKNKQWEYVMSQVEVRDRIIEELTEIAEYYKNANEILIEMIDETRETMEDIGVKISNKKEYYEVMGENRKLNNIMETRLETIKKMTRRS